MIEHIPRNLSILLRPAYGRTYEHLGTALAHWNEGKDFVVEGVWNGICNVPEIERRIGGRYCSHRDVQFMQDHGIGNVRFLLTRFGGHRGYADPKPLAEQL